MDRNAVSKATQELVVGESLEHLEAGFQEIVEQHSDPYFRRWAAVCKDAVRVLRQFELDLGVKDGMGRSC